MAHVGQKFALQAIGCLGAVLGEFQFPGSFGNDAFQILTVALVVPFRSRPEQTADAQGRAQQCAHAPPGFVPGPADVEHCFGRHRVPLPGGVAAKYGEPVVSRWQVQDFKSRSGRFRPTRIEAFSDAAGTRQAIAVQNRPLMLIAQRSKADAERTLVGVDFRMRSDGERLPAQLQGCDRRSRRVGCGRRNRMELRKSTAGTDPNRTIRFGPQGA